MNLPKAHWAYDKSVAGLYPHNPDKAKQLLAEAGFKDGLSIDLIGYPDQDSVQRQEILIEQFRKAGMNVKFSNAPIAEASAAFFGAEKRGSGLLAAWTGRPDPSLTYSLMFTKDAYYNGGRAPVPRGTRSRDQGVAGVGRHRDAPQGFRHRAAAGDGKRVRGAARASSSNWSP